MKISERKFWGISSTLFVFIVFGFAAALAWNMRSQLEYRGPSSVSNPPSVEN